MNGGIFFDDKDAEILNPKGKKAALDFPVKDREKVSKEKKEDILFPDDEEFDTILPKERPKRDKSERRSKGSSRINIEVPQDLLDEYGDLLGEFDPSTSSKKKFREFRKLLTRISLVRYPKKQKEKKSKKRNG